MRFFISCAVSSVLSRRPLSGLGHYQYNLYFAPSIFLAFVAVEAFYLSSQVEAVGEREIKYRFLYSI